LNSCEKHWSVIERIGLLIESAGVCIKCVRLQHTAFIDH
jgi:hypothetical protein